MADTATLNVRMDAETKEKFTEFCEEVGMSASSLMNVFAKTVVRNQSVPFPISAGPCPTPSPSARRLFPRSSEELDAMLAVAEARDTSECVPAAEGFDNFEGHMGW